MEMKDDPRKFGDARNISMTMPQTQPAAPPSADSRPTPKQLAKANINPVTGLATDYLNHFNEAIMLLDLVATVPECLPDLMAWRAMSYQEHFASSRFKDRELAVAAYRAADPIARSKLEQLTDEMTAILLATINAMMMEGCAVETSEGASKAATRLRELVARAGAVINGRPNYQVLFDTLFEH
jgi:hypothetical protein